MNKKMMLLLLGVFFLGAQSASAWNYTMVNLTKKGLYVSYGGIPQTGDNMFSSGCALCGPLKIHKNGKNWIVDNAGQIKGLFKIPAQTTVTFKHMGTQSIVCIDTRKIRIGYGQAIPTEPTIITTAQQKRIVEAWDAFRDIGVKAAEEAVTDDTGEQVVALTKDILKEGSSFLDTVNTCASFDFLITDNGSGGLDLAMIR